ncbi:hypothetical protein, variant [Aphanomyces invadans]|uniref:Pseudouridine synthase RsuA/RluA-like domain-containing protein n=1 Tax=Aphanomyces invadans TaxID=157072 RepID=A0A024U360_9STRA|nr:hypothetical protein, variant [Aphanomyces invadans]ETW00322.1 hypothetical protein, variant [Aphanomyces invadans]|eukprot:XP_008871347.1 hypothetical protein, variant [Aphanomyces invadans]
MAAVSKNEAKRLLKKRERAEKKAKGVADGTWTNPRKRRNQRAFHCETRDTIDDMIHETASETRPDGFRYVAPYKHTFQVHVKARWFGKALLQMFVEEFGGYSADYYAAAIRHGFITLNGQLTSASTLVKDGDLLEHVTHRHEPRVQAFNAASMVAYESDEMVIVNKPSTIPVHPCGAYRHNSIVFILAKDANLYPVFPVHRLDRLTSGLLVLAKSAEVAADLSTQLIDRSVQKYYFAKVLGVFPAVEDNDGATTNESTSTHLSASVAFPDLPPHCTVTTTRLDGHGYFHVSAPLGRIADLENRHGIVPDGKASETLVRCVGRTSDGHSILHCLPLTGRQHQIRVHLQALRFPIANDPLYGPKAFVAATIVDPAAQTPRLKPQVPSVSHEADKMAKITMESICDACQIGEHITFNWEQRHCQGIYLHAFRYKGATWDFSVPPPSWAS